jgi:hypothetical protein
VRAMASDFTVTWQCSQREHGPQLKRLFQAHL